MKKNYIPVLRAFVAGVTSAMLTFAFMSPASAAPGPDGHPNMAHNCAGPHVPMQAHLEKEAQRLGITAAQQPQWDAYAKAVESPMGDMQRLPPDADAATIARHHADMAAGAAAKLARIADATTALQATLSPAQRTMLAHMVRHACPHAWHQTRDRDHPHPGNDSPAGAPAK